MLRDEKYQEYMAQILRARSAGNTAGKPSQRERAGSKGTETTVTTKTSHVLDTEKPLG